MSANTNYRKMDPIVNTTLPSDDRSSYDDPRYKYIFESHNNHNND